MGYVLEVQRLKDGLKGGKKAEIPFRSSSKIDLHNTNIYGIFIKIRHKESAAINFSFWEKVFPLRRNRKV